MTAPHPNQFRIVPESEVQEVAALYLDKWSYRQISERTGLTPNQIRSRLERAGCRRSRLETYRLRSEQARVPRARALGERRPDRDGHSLGQRLRALRQAAGYSLYRVAKEAGIDSSFVKRLELGQRNTQPAILEAIARALGCSALERGRLLVQAGYAPAELTDWSEALMAVEQAERLIPEDQRAEFTRQVRQLVEWWMSEAEDGSE